MNRIQEKRLKKEIDERAQEAIRRLQKVGALPTIRTTRDSDGIALASLSEQEAEARGYRNGIQHCIHVLHQMQENYHGKMSCDSAISRLERELQKAENNK